MIEQVPDLTPIISSNKYLNAIGISVENAGSQKPKIVTNEIVEFYGSEKNGNNDKFGKWLTNCSSCRVEVFGEVFNSSEHAYQCAKGMPWLYYPEDIIAELELSKEKCEVRVRPFINHMNGLSPVAVAKAGRTAIVPYYNDEFWNLNKDSIMFTVLIAKFTQNEVYKAKLIETGDAVLIERAPIDAYWAINNKGAGKNMLGLELMKVREILINGF